MLAGSTCPGVGIHLSRWAGEEQLGFLEMCGFPRLLLFDCERLLFGCFILSSLCGQGGAGASSVTCLGHVTGLGIHSRESNSACSPWWNLQDIGMWGQLLAQLSLQVSPCILSVSSLSRASGE